MQALLLQHKSRLFSCFVSTIRERSLIKYHLNSDFKSYWIMKKIRKIKLKYFLCTLYQNLNSSSLSSYHPYSRVLFFNFSQIKINQEFTVKRDSYIQALQSKHSIHSLSEMEETSRSVLTLFKLWSVAVLYSYIISVV